jgi:class 3 adenylate cyclase
MTALVHDRTVLDNPDLVKTVTAAARMAVENERLRGQVEAQASEARTLPTGQVTFLSTDIEGSTGLLPATGPSVRRPPGRGPRRHPERRAPNGRPRGRRARG